MKHLKLFTAIFMALASVLYYSCKEEEPLEVTGSVGGTVIDKESDQAISSVHVSIVSNSNSDFEEQSKVTGNDGKFSFSAIAEGAYKISFSKEGYMDNSKSVTVKAGSTSTADVQMVPIQPELKLSVMQLDFGEENNNLSLEITNAGEGTLTWSVVEDLAWLVVSPLNGEVTTGKASVTITVDRDKLPDGTSSGTVIFNSNGGSQTLTVNISKPQPILKTTPGSLDFGDTETEKTISVSNVGVGALSYTASSGQSWISLENEAGTVSKGDIKTIEVKVLRAGLTPNNYPGTITITSNNNAVEIPVAMEVVQATAPSVLNGSASGIKNNEAQMSGNINSIGSSAVTQHGHCWSTSPNPSVSNNKTTLGGTNATGAFSSTLSGLSPSTTYYVKAYATNEVGTAYSDEITFTTLAPPTMATVTTGSEIAVRYNEADIYGSITTLGDGLVTDYGFCYSASNANPTTADSKTSLGQTTNVGQFNGTITGLNALTSYYVRAYAVNSMGTAYGTSIEITTPTTPPLVTSGLVAYWTFDEGNCNVRHGDAMYDGIQQGASTPSPSDDIPGATGKSMQFDGNSYYYLPTSPYKGNTKEYTSCMWIKTTTSTTSFIRHENRRGGVSYPSAAIVNSKIYCSNSGSSVYGEFSINMSSFVDGGWHFLVITNNDDTQKLYVDGRYLSTVNCSISSVSDNNPFYIGHGFTGKMDNLRVYNRELTQSEITELYNAKQ